jgi:hypothetical protein
MDFNGDAGGQGRRDKLGASKESFETAYQTALARSKGLVALTRMKAAAFARI